jgi:hypothetical protein
MAFHLAAASAKGKPSRTTAPECRDRIDARMAQKRMEQLAGATVRRRK